jgi:arylsulfatase
VVNYFDPFSLVRDAEAVREVPDDYYITDALNEHAVKYVRDMSAGDEPFFLYLAHTAPHWPLHARPQDIEKYKDTYSVGWQAIREARYRRQVEMGLIDPDTTRLSQRDRAEPDWSENRTQAWDARAMAVHAAMIDRVDQGVGRLIDTLRQLGELDNTLIFVLSDNGASPENYPQSGFDRVSQTRDGEAVRYSRGMRTRRRLRRSCPARRTRTRISIVTGRMCRTHRCDTGRRRNTRAAGARRWSCIGRRG